MTDRQNALAWWRQLSPQTQFKLITKHFPNHIPILIAISSGRIEEMYKKENHVSDKDKRKG